MPTVQEDDSSELLYSVQPISPKICSVQSQNSDLNSRPSGRENGNTATVMPSCTNIETDQPEALFTRKDFPTSAKSTAKNESSLSRCSRSISSGLENGFFCYGKTVATYPCLFILFCLALTGICSIGLLTFTMEERPFKLWIPQDSDFFKIAEWQQANFPNKYRIHTSLYEADNVLTPEVLLDLLFLHETVSSTVALVPDNQNSVSPTALNNSDVRNSSVKEAMNVRLVTWQDVCTKLPTIMSSTLFGRKKRSAGNNSLNPFTMRKGDDVFLAHRDSLRGPVI